MHSPAPSLFSESSLVLTHGGYSKNMGQITTWTMPNRNPPDGLCLFANSLDFCHLVKNIPMKHSFNLIMVLWISHPYIFWNLYSGKIGLELFSVCMFYGPHNFSNSCPLAQKCYIMNDFKKHPWGFDHVLIVLAICRLMQIPLLRARPYKSPSFLGPVS